MVFLRIFSLFFFEAELLLWIQKFEHTLYIFSFLSCGKSKKYPQRLVSIPNHCFHSLWLRRQRSLLVPHHANGASRVQDQDLGLIANVDANGRILNFHVHRNARSASFLVNFFPASLWIVTVGASDARTRSLSDRSCGLWNFPGEICFYKWTELYVIDHWS